MNILDRYVLRSFLKVLMWSVLAFVAVFLLVDLFDHLDNFLDDNASTMAILRYYFFQLPMVIDLVLPVGMLLASLFTIGILSKNNEYTAMLSAGVSLARLSRWILVLALGVSCLALVFRETVVAEANHRQTEVKKYEIEGKIREGLRGKANFTYLGQGGRVYVVSRFRPRPPTLESLSVQTFQDSTMVRRVDAARAVWKGDHWLLQNGTVREFGAAGERVEAFEEHRLDGAVETPADFSRRQVDPEDMTYRQLAHFADWVRRTGGDPLPYRAAMAHKLSFPLVNLLLVVLGISLGAGRRKTTLWAGFGITVGLAFLYYLFMDFGLELGKSGTVPVWLSAWAGNILYAVSGALLFRRANH